MYGIYHLHISGEDTDVACSTTLNCSSSAVNTSARDCCVNRVNGLSYSIPGKGCFQCIGW